MPQLGVLFDVVQSGDAGQRPIAYQTLFTALDPAQLAGCSLGDGEVDSAGARRFCIAIASDDAAQLAEARNALSESEAGGLAPPAERFLEEPRINQEPLLQSARIDSAGESIDCEEDWLKQAWELGRMRRQTVSSPEAAAEAQPETAVATTVPAPPPALRNHAAIPPEIPRSLAPGEARLRLLAGLGGAGLGVASSVLLFLLARKGSMLEQMFNLRGVSVLIPMAISSMFFWGVLICLQRWRRLRALEPMSARSLLLDATQALSAAGPAALAKEIDDPVCQASPLLRRLEAVLKQWLIRPGLQDADLVLQQYIAHDEEGVHAGYTLVRTFVWALPVLGLIGTVIGISLAVGGFASFLGGNIDDVAIVKQNLVGVTGGLSFAFLITLQGLLTSLLLMLAASALQTREEKLYAALQQGIADHFLPALQMAAPVAEPSAGAGAVETLRESLREVAGGVVESLRAESLRMLTAMDDRQMTHREQSLEWAQALRNETEAGAARLGEAASRVAAGLAGAGGDFLKQLAQAQAVFDRQAEGWRVALEVTIRASTEQQAGMKIALSEQAQALESAAAALARLDATTRSALEQQTVLQSVLSHLNEAKLGQAFAGFAAALAEQSSRTQSATEALIGVTRMTGQMLQAQTDLQTSMSQLRDAGLTQTLTDFRDSLANLGPVLESFRQPFVWQAMPLSNNAHRAD